MTLFTVDGGLQAKHSENQVVIELATYEHICSRSIHPLTINYGFGQEQMKALTTSGDVL